MYAIPENPDKKNKCAKSQKELESKSNTLYFYRVLERLDCVLGKCLRCILRILHLKGFRWTSDERVWEVVVSTAFVKLSTSPRTLCYWCFSISRHFVYGPLRLQQQRLYFSSIKVRHSKCSSNEIYPDPHRILYNVTKVTMTKYTIQLKRRLRRLTAEVCNRRPTYEAWFSTFILLYFYTRTLLLAVGAGTKPLPTSE